MDRRFWREVVVGDRKADLYLGDDGAWHVDCYQARQWVRSEIRGGERALEESNASACKFVNVVASPS